MSSPSGSGESPKWSCDYCTYLNWPSATKCTLCRARKPLELITDYNSHPGPDIYQLAKIDQTTAASDSSALLDSSEVTKWTCPTCTYLNWPRSVRCVQCSNLRNKRFPDDLESIVKEEKSDVGAKSPRQSSEELSIAGEPPPIKSDSQQGSPGAKAIFDAIGANWHNRSVSASPTANEHDSQQPSSSAATLIDSRILAKKLQKWTCPGCTYENWPKCNRCVMCYTPKPNSSVSNRDSPTLNSSYSPGGSPLYGSDNEGGNNPVNDKKRNYNSVTGAVGSHSYKSPRSASSSTENVNTEVGAAAASISVTEVINSGDQHVADVIRPTRFPFKEERDMLLRRLRKRLRDIDWLWLNACNSIAAGNSCDSIEAYLAAGGDPARVLLQGEVKLLQRLGTFEVGQTLLHLAVKFGREDLLTLLLTCTDQTFPYRRIKKVPCHVSPDIASDIRRQIAMTLRQRKGEFPSFFFTDTPMFSLPSGIYDLRRPMQERLFDELLDKDVQKELEEESPIINWSCELTDRLSSRLYALWNRTAGDCLLDSVLQATWGVFDSENSLRQALADSLNDAANIFYPRWKEYESLAASALHFSLDENQWARDWDLVLQLASKPGSALEQAHVFALAHIIRRPIIVYGVRVVKSFRGETIGYARFEGVYLPLLWEPSFCWRSPICLGYTRGHFSALVPMEPDPCEGGAARMRDNYNMQSRYVYLPLTDADGQMLPLHFLGVSEVGHEQSMLRTWLDCTVTEGGLLVCKMKLHRPPPLVQQMLGDWLEYYNQLTKVSQAASAMIQSRQQQSGGRNTRQPSTSSANVTPPPLTTMVNSGSGNLSPQHILPPSLSPLSSGSGSNTSQSPPLGCQPFTPLRPSPVGQQPKRRSNAAEPKKLGKSTVPRRQLSSPPSESEEKLTPTDPSVKSQEEVDKEEGNDENKGELVEPVAPQSDKAQ